ncbi:MAG: hypothetical protein IPG61_11270 [bacterium]|nr:hypothetical protein [bacterium]MBK7672444.1 hypothetical protein [bacterium]
MSDDNQERDKAGNHSPVEPRADDAGRQDAGQQDAERDALRHRAFDLATAIARAGAGNLKGASPVPAARQLVLAVTALLAARLPDSEGSLVRVLGARLEDDPNLQDRHRGAPAAALAELLDRALASPTSLADLVREVDARWGRDYDERPRFEANGRPPAPDDPYTIESVRTLLKALRDSL